MRSVAVVIESELLEPSPDGSPTAHPRGMEAVGAHFEGVKPFFDEVSRAIVEPTAQSETGEGSRVTVAIDKKLCVRNIVFLGEAVKKRRCWIGAVTAEHGDIQQ